MVVVCDGGGGGSVVVVVVVVVAAVVVVVIVFVVVMVACVVLTNCFCFVACMNNSKSDFGQAKVGCLLCRRASEPLPWLEE